MRKDEVFPSPWLKASDLGEQELTVTISMVTLEAIGEEREKKPVVWFHDEPKGLILNKTNWEAIEAAHGKESDAWRDKVIVLSTQMVEAFGKTVPAIRVKVSEPQPSAD